MPREAKTHPLAETIALGCFSANVAVFFFIFFEVDTRAYNGSGQNIANLVRETGVDPEELRRSAYVLQSRCCHCVEVAVRPLLVLGQAHAVQDFTQASMHHTNSLCLP